MKQTIPRLLWADEIILADVSITPDIRIYASELGPKVKYFHLSEDDSTKRILSLLPKIESDYVLVVDTDEFYNEDLAAEILSELTLPCKYSGFHVPVVNYWFGSCFGPGTPFLRLWRKSAANFPVKGSPHDNITVNGDTKTLKNSYDHIDNPKLSIGAVKNFRYSTIWASRMSDSELERRRIDALKGIPLWMHSLKSLARINVRFLRTLYQLQKHGYAGLCLSYGTILRVMAEDVAATEEWRMRNGLAERSNRGYW